jgi:hypothetical protein
MRSAASTPPGAHTLEILLLMIDGAECGLREPLAADDHRRAGKGVAREHGGERRRGTLEREEGERHLRRLGRLDGREVESACADAEAGGQRRLRGEPGAVFVAMGESEICAGHAGERWVARTAE